MKTLLIFSISIFLLYAPLAEFADTQQNAFGTRGRLIPHIPLITTGESGFTVASGLLPITIQNNNGSSYISSKTTVESASSITFYYNATDGRYHVKGLYHSFLPEGIDSGVVGIFFH